MADLCGLRQARSPALTFLITKPWSMAATGSCHQSLCRLADAGSPHADQRGQVSGSCSAVLVSSTIRPWDVIFNILLAEIGALAPTVIAKFLHIRCTDIRKGMVQVFFTYKGLRLTHVLIGGIG